MERKMDAIVKDLVLPFKVGQMVEVRSFIKGYRGAWFRCEIKEINEKGSCVRHLLSYTDYPDEKDKWTKSYERPPIGWSKKREKQLMLRPQYPRIYRSDQVPLVDTISEVIVVCDGAWRVGDHVDWFEEGCFWSAQVTQLLGDGKAMEGRIFHQCAQIVYPMNQTVSDRLVTKAPAEGGGYNPISYRFPSNSATNSHVQLGSPKNEEMQLESGIRPKEVIGTSEKRSRLTRDGVEFPKNVKSCVEVPLNSTHEDSFEAAIADLEELANKLSWLKNILKFGMPSSNVDTSLWEFVEQRGSSLPK